ncbi:hypothetical protein ACFU7D_16110 [Nocardioides sp. NPDC057577]|uniref:hypothetical protein n=1 Tax=Nocardioides sp. NPDC057577 TaxID=3346171 RepID=UPI00366DE601
MVDDLLAPDLVKNICLGCPDREVVAVVVSIDDYRRMSEPKVSLAEYLLSGPKIDDLDLERDRSLPRDLDVDELR